MYVCISLLNLTLPKKYLKEQYFFLFNIGTFDIILS